MLFEDERKVVAHMLSHIVACPWSFKNYSIVREKPPFSPREIDFICEDECGVLACTTMQYADYLFTLKLKPTDAREPHYRYLDIILIDPETTDVICQQSIHIGKDLNVFYIALQDISYQIMLIVHQLLAKYVESVNLGNGVKKGQ